MYVACVLYRHCLLLRVKSMFSPSVASSPPFADLITNGTLTILALVVLLVMGLVVFARGLSRISAINRGVNEVVLAMTEDNIAKVLKQCASGIAFTRQARGLVVQLMEGEEHALESGLTGTTFRYDADEDPNAKKPRFNLGTSMGGPGSRAMVDAATTLLGSKKPPAKPSVRFAAQPLAPVGEGNEDEDEDDESTRLLPVAAHPPTPVARFAGGDGDGDADGEGLGEGAVDVGSGEMEAKGSESTVSTSNGSIAPGATLNPTAAAGGSPTSNSSSLVIDANDEKVEEKSDRPTQVPGLVLPTPSQEGEGGDASGCPVAHVPQGHPPMGSGGGGGTCPIAHVKAVDVPRGASMDDEDAAFGLGGDKPTLEQVVSASPGIVVLTDSIGTVLYINQAFTKMLGYTYE